MKKNNVIEIEFQNSSYLLYQLLLDKSLHRTF